MAKLELEIEIEWKWWTVPIFWFSELPLVRDWKGFQDFLGKFFIYHGYRIKGWEK